MGLRAQVLRGTDAETTWLLDPRVALGWDFSDRTSAHLSWGHFHQEDEAHELKVEDGLGAFPAAQLSQHLILGLRHAPRPGLDLRAEVFSKHQTAPRARFENLFSRRTILPELSPDRVQVLPEDAELRGVELSVQWRRGDFESWLSTGWSEALDETGGDHTHRNWDGSFTAAGGVQWAQGPWSAQAVLSMRRGLPTTGLLASSSGAALGPRNALRLPGFRQLDLRAQYQQPVTRGELRYSFELLNALNSPNECCAVLDGSNGALQLRRQQGLPLFPSLGVRWTW